MAIQVQGNGGTVAEVDGTVHRAMRTAIRAIDHGALGHYRVTHRHAIVATQAANSRLFEIRNTHATQLLVLTDLRVKWLQAGAHTAAIENSLDAFRVTGFSAVDTTNTVTLTPSVKRTAGMAAAASSIAAIRGVTVAGAAAGMTGGTLTKDAGPFEQIPAWLLAAQPTANTVIPALADADVEDIAAHPFVFALNEGIILENRVLLGAAAGSSVYITAAWAEVPVY